MRTYNLFCREDQDELVCAVPEDQPVPSFITGPPWDFIGRVQESVIGSMGFNHGAAEASVQMNGFYLFQLIHASDLQKARQGCAAEAVDETPNSGKNACQAAPGHPSEIRISPVVRLASEAETSRCNRVAPARPAQER
jgi:hypothetical protein